MTKISTVAIGGMGAIGYKVACALDEGLVPNTRLVAIAARDLEKAQRRLSHFSNPAKILPLEELSGVAEIVIECCPPNLFDLIARPAIEDGRILVVLSSGQLLTRTDLIKRATQTEAQIIVPTGALLGLDAVRAAKEGVVHSVTLVTRKPPESLSGAPFVEDNAINLHQLEKPTKLFSGNAREAASGFPANINVAVALSMAGIGAELTNVEIWADPTVDRNTHTINVLSDAANFEMTIGNIPSEENPRTGKLTPLSVLATLRRLSSTLKVGS